MKLKGCLAVLVLFFSVTVFANNQHLHPKAEDGDKRANWASYCEVEIRNNSMNNLRLNGIFDDGWNISFNIYRYDLPHYISLYYYGYCHRGMHIYIDTFDGERIFSSYVYGGQTIFVEDYYGNSVKATLKNK